MKLKSKLERVKARAELELAQEMLLVATSFFVRHAHENAPKFEDKSVGEARMEWLEFLVQWADEAEYVEV